MALTVDATSVGNNTSTFGISHTVTAANSNKLLIVGIGSDAAGGASITGVTYAGVSMTQAKYNVNGTRAVSLWKQIAPATGTNTIQITPSTGINIEAYGISFYNADQTTGLGAIDVNTGNTQTITASVTTTANNSYVVDSAITITNAITVGGSQTQIQNVAQNGWEYGGSRITAIVAAPATKTLTWSIATSSQVWATIVAEVLDGTPSSAHNLPLTGTGT